MEKIAEAITPLLSDDWEIKEAKKVGVYKYRLIKYIKEKNDKRYSNYMEDELKELHTRVQKLYNIGNSGVHEDWLRSAFTTTALRLILLISDFFLPTKIIKPKIIYEPGIFEE